jgi:hypothetical protein
LARYCSDACRQEARRWSRWRAAHQYRRTEEGRARRREQASRYRQRVKQRAGPEPQEPQEPPGEGHQEAPAARKICCARPGCYVRFVLDPRSPCQRCCGPLCRKALRRVRVREARWRRGQAPADAEPSSAQPQGP